MKTFFNVQRVLRHCQAFCGYVAKCCTYSASARTYPLSPLLFQVHYGRFSDDVDTVFGPKYLEATPLAEVPIPGAGVTSPSAADTASCV